MSFFELYRSNIPLFVPSAKLLMQWIQARALRHGDPSPHATAWGSKPAVLWVDVGDLAGSRRDVGVRLLHWQDHGVMWERVYGTPERRYNESSEPDSPNDNRSLG